MNRSSVSRRVVLLSSCLWMPLVGCDSADSPTEVEEVDVDFAVEAMADILGVLQGPGVEASLVQIAEAFADAADPRPLPPDGFPHRGSTLVYDPAPQAWVVDEDRTDAPAAGVRIVTYELVPTNTPALPLSPAGWVDVGITSEDEESVVMFSEIVSTEAGGESVVAEYEMTYQGSGGGGGGGFFLAAGGQVGEPGVSLDFEVVSTVSVPAGGTVGRHTSRVEFSGGGLGEFDQTLEVDVDPGTLEALDDAAYVASVSRSDGVLTFDVSIGVDDSVSGVVRVNGRSALRVSGTVPVPRFDQIGGGGDDSVPPDVMKALWARVRLARGIGLAFVAPLDVFLD